MTIREEWSADQLVGRAINRLRFKSNVWNADIDYDRVFQMVNDVRTLAGMEKMTRATFDDGIKYCRVYAYNYKFALSEFRALCWGDW